MAKGAYIGVDGKARKIKAGYIGAMTDIPIYETRTVTETITASNITEFFEVTYGSPYTFVGNGSVFTSNNKGVASSSAKITLKPKYDMTISFGYSVSSESKYDKLLVEGSGAHELSGDGSSGSWDEKSIPSGNSIYFTYSKDGSQDSYDDEAKFYDMVVTCTKPVLVDVETRSAARRIKKAYIGIGGVARPCWGGSVEYYGVIDPMKTSRYQLAAGTVGNYALFHGGYGSGGTLAAIDAYDSLLTRTTPASSGSEMYLHATANVGRYLVVGAGWDSSTMEAFDDTLTRIGLDARSRARTSAAASVGNYALFYYRGGYSVATYDSTLTYVSGVSLTMDWDYAEAASTGNYAVFGGGLASNTSQSHAEAVDGALTKTTVDALSVARIDHATVKLGGYAFFAGGYNNSSGVTNAVDVYDSSLTHLTPQTLGKARYKSAASALGDLALFAGGYTAYASAPTPSVEAYDTSLTRADLPDQATARSDLAAATIGNFALFAGGNTATSGGYSHTEVVEAYTI